MSFVHLHNHTHYSLLDGLTKIDDLIAKAKSQNCPALAITDHGNMYGVIEFYQKCLKAGIKPIIGVEAYLAPGSRFDKGTRDDARNYYHLLLLAKNNTGYQNLIKLVSKSHLEGFYYKPRIDWELLEEFHEGLIASTACLGGEIPVLIQSGRLDLARQRILDYNQLFGEGNFYLEVMDHPELENQDMVNQQLIKFSQELNVPLVATNDIHYLDKDDDEAQDILLCLQNKKKRSDTDRMRMMGYGDYSCRDPQEIVEAFKDTPSAISNTVKIAEACNVEIDLKTTHLPYFSVPESFDENSYLRHLCSLGIEGRYGKSNEEIDKRLDYELEVIAKMGWPSYFLIVADLVNWAKDNGIVVGPGRGSAAGSLVCYLTNITNVDPLKYELLFERFLNPDRISMPDIDLDFADTRRDEVIRYVAQKYGEDHVSQIITFGTMAARAAIRDVGRVLDEPYDYCDKLAKMIPSNYKIKDAIENLNEVKEIYEREVAARKILDFAQKLEGVSRHASTHACGVLITKEPLTNYVPLQYASSSDQSIISQYSLGPVDDLGLLKVDFLGLKNLSVIEAAIKIIKNTQGVIIDIEKVPLDDEKTLNLFKKGETTGVFQFESSGMKRYLKELKPSEFEDIVAMVALYRPGPMEWIPDFISGKHGRNMKYLHPKLEPILRKTYGVAVYQEQVMQISRELAGFSRGEADTLRKAMGKKIPELLAEQKEKFINGCVANGIDQVLAEKVFSFIEPFAGYGFNRSHAVCYALIGYQTAYLKANYPVEFMAALLTADQNDTDRIAIEIEECRQMGIEIKAPDINESFASFTVLKDSSKPTIRFGLKAIKNVGAHIVEEIIDERKRGGSFSNIFDLLERVSDKDLNKKSLESLIKAGALDQLEDRAVLVDNIEVLLNFSKAIKKDKDSSQLNLFGEDVLAPVYPSLEKDKELNDKEKLQWEKDLLGLYISEHPFSFFRSHLSDFCLPLTTLKDHIGQDIFTAGVISSIKKIITKKNENMLFVKIEDGISMLEVLVFPKILKEQPDLWQEGRVVLLNANVSDKDGEIKLLVNKAINLKEEGLESDIEEFKKIKISSRNNYQKNNQSSASLGIVFKEKINPEILEQLKKFLEKYPGSNSVYFKLSLDQGESMIKSDFKVKLNETLKEDLRKNFSGNLEVV